MGYTKGMGKAYSVDLRLRVLAAIDSGVSKMQVHQSFQISRSTIDDWLRRSEEQGDLGLIQRLSMQVRRPDLGRADRAEGIQEGHMKVPLSPTKSLFPFRAGSSGRTILHEFKEKPVEPTTLRQPEEKPTGHTTASKPK